MLTKPCELKDRALDWAVAKCEGRTFDTCRAFTGHHEIGRMNYSTDWAQGGPIIERERITICSVGNSKWVAGYGIATSKRYNRIGQTPLIAAMRCFVASKLGAEVEIPDELVE